MREFGTAGCLEQSKNPFMFRYDSLPKSIREAIANSNYQLCPACIYNKYSSCRSVVHILKVYIPHMEDEVRKELDYMETV